MNPSKGGGVTSAMRFLLAGVLALFSVGCVSSNDYEPAPRNFVEVELWEYESYPVSLSFVPSYVTAIYVEVTACVADGAGPGVLWVSTDRSELQLSPRYCSAGTDVHTVWLDLGAAPGAWLDVEPVYANDTTEIFATFEVLGW